MHVERTFMVNRPIDEVFAYLSDFENTNEWDPGTVETKRVSGDGGLGTVYSNTSQFVGRKVDLEYTTVGYDSPTFFSCQGKNTSSTATDSMTFTRQGERTQIHYRADFTFHGFVKLVAPFVVKPKLSDLADETIADITAALQGDAPTS